MNRITNHPGLTSGQGWQEVAYETGDADWPLARVRITLMATDQDDRLHRPSADPVPPRVQVRLSASLINAEGAVQRIADKLLLGPESIHAWQFDADVTFDPAAWLDSCAAAVVSDLLRQARGIAAAANAGLLIT